MGLNCGRHQRRGRSMIGRQRVKIRRTAGEDTAAATATATTEAEAAAKAKATAKAAAEVAATATARGGRAGARAAAPRTAARRTLKKAGATTTGGRTPSAHATAAANGKQIGIGVVAEAETGIAMEETTEMGPRGTVGTAVIATLNARVQIPSTGIDQH